MNILCLNLHDKSSKIKVYIFIQIGVSHFQARFKVFFDFEEDSQSDFTFGTSTFTFGSDQIFI